MKVSLVIPAYNESRIIEDTMAQCLEYLRANFDEYELVIVDDCSSDDTKARALRCADEHTRVYGYDEHRGKGCAVRTGMLRAEGDVIVCTDADLAYGLEPVAQAVENVRGSDIVVGSRHISEDGWAGYTFIRRLASLIFAFAVRLISGLDYDTQCGFKCFGREAARRIFSVCTTDGFAYDFEVMMLADGLGMSIRQQAVTVINHRESTVHLLRDALRMLRDVLRIRASVKKRLPEEIK